jgi:hypothetical protein
MATDEFTNDYTDLLDGSYDCVDRFVLNANFGLGYSPGGFRSWWRRLHNGSDAELDNTHLMRMAGRFSRRVRGWAQAHDVPVIDCGGEERKHLIAEEHLKKNPCIRGLFLILVGRAVATVWDVKRSSTGVIQNLEAKRPFINHYSFHIMDPDWGHVTIPRLGHRSFLTVMNTWPVKLGRRASHLQRRVTVLLFCPIEQTWQESQTPCPRYGL